MARRPTRTRVNVREHTRFERADDGRWVATFDVLGVTAEGESEDGAWQALLVRANDVLAASEELQVRWRDWVAENGVLEEVPEEELRARDDVVTRSREASSVFRSISVDELEQEISGDTPTLIDFWAEWCMPCHHLAPVLRAAADELGDRIRVLKLNVDENKDVWERFAIEGIPTMILFRGGQERARVVGAGRSKAQLLAEVEPHLS